MLDLFPARSMSDIPWLLLAYLAIGFPIAWRYQHRDDHPEKDHLPDVQIYLTLFLAFIWPLLLLAMLANRK